MGGCPVPHRPRRPSLSLASSYPSLVATVVDGSDGGAAIDSEKVELTVNGIFSATSLVMYETITGGNWVDSNGVGPNLAVGDSASGVVGDALNEATADSGGISPGVALAGNLSHGFWFEASSDNRNRDDYVLRESFDDGTNYLEINLHSDGDATYTLTQNGVTVWNGALTDGWHHFVTSRASFVCTGYVDSVAQTPVAEGGAATTGSPICSLYCGDYPARVSQPFLQPRAWSAAQVSRFYNAGLGRLYSDRNVVATGSSPLSFSTDANGIALAAGTSYTARAASHNSVGWGAWGATDSETLVSLPTAPSALTAGTITTTSIGLSWTDNSNNEDNFLLEKSLHGANSWSTVSSPAANATTATASGLSPGTAYDFRLSAVNTAGASSTTALNNVSTTAAATGGSGMTGMSGMSGMSGM
jgi:hypothetical protein